MKHYFTKPNVACCKIESGQQKILKTKKHPSLLNSLLFGLMFIFLAVGAEKKLTAQTSNGLSFQNSYVTIGNQLSVALSNKSAVTIEAWVNPTMFTPMGTVFCTRVGHTNKLQVYTDGTGRVNFLIGTNGNRFMARTVDPISLNTWHHIAAVFDGTEAIGTNRLKIYVNGVLQAVTNPETQYSTTTGTYNVPSRIGDEVSPMFPALIRGVLDEVRIWTEARSAAEVLSAMTNELSGTEANLVAYYNFNQGIPAGNNTAITTLFDKTGKHNGTLTGFSLTNGNTTSNFIGSTVGPSTSAPSITSFTPTTAITGQTVTITGENLSGTSAVSFGGTAAASLINVNSITITAVVASGASGDVSLTTLGSTANLSGFTYVSVPDAPTAVSAAAGYAQATVSFTPPAYEGSSEITDYTVTSSPGGITATGTESPITIAGLTNETAYTFTVTATNSVGTGAASTPSNSVTPSTFIYGNALNFSQSFVAVDNQLSHSLSNQSAITIETWVKFDAFTRLGTIFSQRQDHTYKIQFGLDDLADNDRLFFQIGSNGNLSSAFTESTINLDTWYHVAAVFDGTEAIPSNSLKIYINGELQIVTNWNNNFSTTTGDLDVVTFIGSEDSYPSVPLYGSMDETRIWTTARTQSELQGNMSAILTGTEPGLAAYYRYDQGIAAGDNTSLPLELIDYSGNCNHGTMNSFALNGPTSNWIASEKNSVPIPTTLAPTALTNYTATLNGQIFSIGAENATTRGFIYSTTNCPTLANSVVSETGSFSAETYNIPISGLTPGTTYYVRAYTINSFGTSYGETQSFTAPQLSQTITFDVLTTRTYGDAPFTIIASGGESGNPVVFTSSDPTIATCSGTNASTITIVGVGNCTIYANQEGSAIYAPATQVSQALTVNPKGLTISDVTASNKVYDGNTSATLIAGTLNGVETGDVVLLTAGSGTFATANVGTAIVVNASGYALSGADAANYTVSQPTGLTADITAKALTISGAAASDKEYDGNTNASITGTLAGIVGTDNVNFTGTGTFASTNVGSEISVTSTGSLNGADAENYTLTQPTGLTADITAKALTISGATASDKVYDGNTDATITGTLTGIVGADDVTHTGTGTFASANVGSGINITSAGSLNGTDAGNYSLTQPTGLTAEITAKALTISGAAASDKEYDGNTNATITGTLTGLVGADDVTLTGTGTFASANVGSGINVTSTSSLNGADAGNYTLTQPTGLTADITAKALTISGATASDKEYDGNTNATITGTLAGIVGADDIAFTGTGIFASANVGSGINVTSTGSLNGADAGNYSLTQPTGLTADITAKALTISGAVASDKVYDGNTDASITGMLAGIVGTDNVNFTDTGTFASNNVGSGINVTFTGSLSGTDAGNYSLTQPTGLTAEITAKALTISSAAASDKVYDGNTDATITGTLAGIVGTDNVNFTGTGTFASNNVGSGINVTFTGSLSGTDAGNYSLTQPTGLTAEITAKALTISSAAASDKVYDGNTNATITGTLAGLVGADDVTLTCTGTFASANVGSGINVTSTGSLNGTDAGNYTLTQPTGLSANITVRELTISNTVVETTKEYDGNTIAEVISKGTISGVVVVDETNLGFTVEANYNDALPGTDKTITVDYTLTGIPASNYVVFGYEITNGVIEGTITPFASYSANPGCSGTEMNLNYTITEGAPIEYRIVFGQAAKTLGFVDIEYSTLPSSEISGFIAFSIPENARYGNYEAQIQLRDETGNESLPETFTFTINLSTDYIVNKFDDLVLFDNSSGEFVSYQWYKDGVLINGATNQFYNDPNGLSGAYSVSAITTDGQTFHSCDKHLKTSVVNAAALRVYPNPVSISEYFVVHIDNLEKDELQGAEMMIYNNSGIMVYATKQVEQQNSIILSLHGVYHGVLITRDGKKLTYKVIVGK